MKKVLILVFMLLSLKNAGFCQSYWKVENLPYNQKSHSVKQHCKFLAGIYALQYSLSGRDRKMLYYDLIDFYKHDHVTLGEGKRADWDYRMMTELNEQLVLRNKMEAEKIHSRLLQTLGALLTYNQYNKYLEMVNPPEYIFAMGAPM